MHTNYAPVYNPLLIINGFYQRYYQRYLQRLATLSANNCTNWPGSINGLSRNNRLYCVIA